MYLNYCFIITKTLLSSYFYILRPFNLLMVGGTQFLVYYFLLGKTSWDFEFILLLSSTILITAGGYLINDFYDKEIDRINKPQKTWVGVHISEQHTLCYYALLNILALGLAFWLGTLIFFVEMACVLLLWLYSFRFKKWALVGNLVVAGLTTFSIGILCLFYQKWTPSLQLLCAFVFWLSLIRELIKDLEDQKGDKLQDCQTLPLLMGESKTLFFVRCLVVILLLGLSVSFLAIQKTGLRVGFALIFALSLWLLITLWQKPNYTQLSKICKLIMLLGMSLIPLMA